jgi:hypothetical protein
LSDDVSNYVDRQLIRPDGFALSISARRKKCGSAAFFFAGDTDDFRAIA